MMIINIIAGVRRSIGSLITPGEYYIACRLVCLAGRFLFSSALRVFFLCWWWWCLWSWWWGCLLRGALAPLFPFGLARKHLLLGYHRRLQHHQHHHHHRHHRHHHHHPRRCRRRRHRSRHHRHHHHHPDHQHHGRRHVNSITANITNNTNKTIIIVGITSSTWFTLIHDLFDLIGAFSYQRLMV